MVQNSFSVLFLLVLAAGALSLLLGVRESWPQISAALLPEDPPESPAVYSTSLTPAAEVPWVAQRLVLRELEEALPTCELFAAWAPRPPAPSSGPQLAFAFASPARG